MEKKIIWKKIIYNLLSHPSVTAPALAGLICMVLWWGFELSLLFVLATLVFGAISLGMIVQRYLLSGEKIAKDAIDEIRKEEDEKRETSLDDLDAKMCEDDDPRTEGLLAELRSYSEAFRKTSWSDGLDKYSALEILSKIEGLFSTCITYLEKQYVLYKQAECIDLKKARDPLNKQRDVLIREVIATVEKMAEAFAKVQTLALESDTSGIEERRKELMQSLEIAARTKEEMGSIGNHDEEEFLRQGNNKK
jgi:hypothetical protein